MFLDVRRGPPGAINRRSRFASPEHVGRWMVIDGGYKTVIESTSGPQASTWSNQRMPECGNRRGYIVEMARAHRRRTCRGGEVGDDGVGGHVEDALPSDVIVCYRRMSVIYLCALNESAESSILGDF